jgi:Ca2+-binding EF-hand superfamily protein
MDVIDVNGDGFISIEELERWPPDPEQITEHKMAT